MGNSNLKNVGIDRAVARRLARARADLGFTMNVIADVLLTSGLDALEREGAKGGGPLTDAINARKAEQDKHAKS